MDERFMRITQELAALRGMTVKELQEKYLELYGEPSASNNKAYLQKRLAYRVQEIAEGIEEDNEAEIAKEVELADQAKIRWRQPPVRPLNRGNTASLPLRDPRLPRPGTVLRKIHRGVEHSVKVLANGFEYNGECNGECYKSLSNIATKISGARWNGFVFFGLNRKR